MKNKASQLEFQLIVYMAELKYDSKSELLNFLDFHFVVRSDLCNILYSLVRLFKILSLGPVIDA